MSTKVKISDNLLILKKTLSLLILQKLFQGIFWGIYFFLTSILIFKYVAMLLTLI
jgi:hypothetical protein